MSPGSSRHGSRANPLEALAERHLAGADAKVRQPERELQQVHLSADVGRWPVGTLGTIVEAFEDGAVVEIASREDGATLDLLTLPYSAVSVLPRVEQTRLAI